MRLCELLDLLDSLAIDRDERVPSTVDLHLVAVVAAPSHGSEWRDMSEALSADPLPGVLYVVRPLRDLKGLVRVHRSHVQQRNPRRKTVTHRHQYVHRILLDPRL